MHPVYFIAIGLAITQDVLASPVPVSLSAPGRQLFKRLDPEPVVIVRSQEGTIVQPTITKSTPEPTPKGMRPVAIGEFQNGTQFESPDAEITSTPNPEPVFDPAHIRPPHFGGAAPRKRLLRPIVISELEDGTPFQSASGQTPHKRLPLDIGEFDDGTTLQASSTQSTAQSTPVFNPALIQPPRLGTPVTAQSTPVFNPTHIQPPRLGAPVSHEHEPVAIGEV